MTRKSSIHRSPTSHSGRDGEERCEQAKRQQTDRSSRRAWRTGRRRRSGRCCPACCSGDQRPSVVTRLVIRSTTSGGVTFLPCPCVVDVAGGPPAVAGGAAPLRHLHVAPVRGPTDKLTVRHISSRSEDRHKRKEERMRNEWLVDAAGPFAEGVEDRAAGALERARHPRKPASQFIFLDKGKFRP